MSKKDRAVSSEDERYKKAKERVEEIKEFYTHFGIYVCVMAGLAVINLLTTGFPWVIFPMAGWGIGVVAHWFSVFGYSTFLGKDWEERKIRELMGDETPYKRKNDLAQDDYFEDEAMEDETVNGSVRR
jgi:2TM domain